MHGRYQKQQFRESQTIFIREPPDRLTSSICKDFETRRPTTTGTFSTLQFS